MVKKIIGLILSAVLIISSAVVYADAAEVNAESSEKTSGTFFFDPRDWGTNEYVLFYIWDADAHEYATRKGWTTDITWGSKNKLGCEASNGKYESYELDLTGREKHKIYLILRNFATGEYTYDCVINSSAFGRTCHITNEFYEPYWVDYGNKARTVVFDGGTNIGPVKMITSTGEVCGDVFPTGTDGTELVTMYILDNLGEKNAVTGKARVTAKIIANAIKGCGTTADKVIARYNDSEHKTHENYKKAEAEKILRESKQYYNPTKLQIGDVDCSGKIDSVDSLLILRASVKLETLDSTQFKLADVDGNKVLTSADSLEVLRYSVNLPSKTNVGKYL